MSDLGDIRQLPVFPLGTVLFPAGHLALRIFEPRYVNMISRCSREGIGFVVAAIQAGQEAGAPATPHLMGTEARIEDWNKDENGLLLIDCRGDTRVRIVNSWLQDDGLRLANVETLAAEPQLPVSQPYAHMWQLLDQIALVPEREEQRTAAWLSGRLAECLPLPLELKQKLLCIADPEERLAELSQHLRGFIRA